MLNSTLESLRRFATEALTNSSLCKLSDNTGAEDAEMGHCLKNVGVHNEDSRDNFGRFRFLPFPVGTHVMTYIDVLQFKQ